MNKGLFLACVVILSLSAVASADTTWNVFFTGSPATWGVPISTPPNYTGMQNATVSVTGTVSTQTEGATGSQGSSPTSQTQTMDAGQTQIISNGGIGTTTASQWGIPTQTQTAPTATQTQTINGTQSATVTGAGSVVQNTVVHFTQYQSY